MSSTTYLDPRLSTLLDSLRARVRRYVVIDALLAIAAVLLSAFWLGVALDYLPVQVGGTEMPRLARTILLFFVGLVVIILTGTLLIGRLHRPLPDDSLALLVERQHPRLGGRLVTAVQLNRADRDGDSHSPKLLRHVHDEAAAAIDEVDPNRVFRWEPLVRKGLIVGPLALCALIFLIVSPQAFALALSRLSLLSDEPWPRRAHLEMVGVELPVVTAADDASLAPELKPFVDGTVRLPRGSNGTLRIRAQADGAELPVVCTVHYRSDDGTRGQSNMRRVGRVVDGFQSFVLDGPPLSDLGESLTLSVRGLDDRLDDFRIESVEPPAITEMKVVERYPAYLRGEGSSAIDSETDYQAGLRVREGSDVTLVAQSSRPLGEVDVLLESDVANQPTPNLIFSDDRMTVELPVTDFRSATTVRIVPRDADGISAQASYRYFVGVILDEPPVLDLDLVGIGIAVTPIAKIPVEAVASDDYGIEKLDLSVALSSESPEPGLSATLTPPRNREGEAKAMLDLRELTAQNRLPELIPGNAINLFAEATDAYDLDGNHLTRSELYRLQLVTPEKLLALMERRELALRARLEQTINETRNLRDTLALLRRSFDASPVTDEDESGNAEATEPPTGEGNDVTGEGNDVAGETEKTRELQLRLLRAQQSGLQASKTSEELSGIATSLDDILQEMINNRVDSVDRRERIGLGVRDPLKQIVEEPLSRLQDQIGEVEKSVPDPKIAAEKSAAAVESAEDVLLRLTEVLDKMLDLESYNEILDMVRELRDDQQKLLDDTMTRKKKAFDSLFE